MKGISKIEPDRVCNLIANSNRCTILRLSGGCPKEIKTENYVEKCWGKRLGGKKRKEEKKEKSQLA